MEFVWDPQKERENIRKHGVSFQEATTVFGDWLGATVADPDHSMEESRFITVGVSSQDRFLLVSHTDRGGKLRIISARPLTRRERKSYEETRHY